LEAIAKLPPSNKDTLAYLILHLQRVAYYSTASKMPLANLVTIFAPMVVDNGPLEGLSQPMLTCSEMPSTSLR
jgi:Rac GTPase-activating protein 1